MNWQTNDGRDIPMCEMSDIHLRNAIAAVERTAYERHKKTLEYGRRQLRYCFSEQARAVVISALNEIIQQGAHRGPRYFALVSERERRLRENNCNSQREWWQDAF